MNLNEKIEKFLNKKSFKKKIIVIYWPTWAWKTDMSINIAKELDSEIISTDSRQIFKYMDIWTWKITEEEKKGVKHHMLDIIEANEKYSVGEFKSSAEKIINDLYSKWKVPILCWWTWLYIDSLIYDFNIPKVPWDPQLRDNLEIEAEKYWKEAIFKKLKAIDPDYDRKLHPNNLRYVIRALEVKLLTWKSKTKFKQEKTARYDVLFLTPDYWSRENLYNRINLRVEWMFKSWLVEEVKWLLKKWYKKNDFWMKSIWYEEVVSYLDWEISLDESISLVQKNSRNYAKRQLTWFRNYIN